MAQISKVLVVVTAVASLAFLGFVAVSAVGGPNWEAEKIALPDYIFETIEGDRVTWTVTARRGGETVKQGSVSLAAAVVAARDHLQQQQTAEIERLSQSTPDVRQRIDDAKQFSQVDLTALQTREQELDAELNQLNEQTERISEEARAKAAQAQAIQANAKSRREEIVRLTNLAAEVQTDWERAVAQRNDLRDLLLRVRGKIDRLGRRKKQLIEAGAKLPDAEKNQTTASAN